MVCAGTFKDGVFCDDSRAGWFHRSMAQYSLLPLGVERVACFAIQWFVSALQRVYFESSKQRQFYE